MTRVQIIEIDCMTGNERELPNYDAENSGWLWTREAAEESIAWRRKHITSRYDYRVEERA